MSLHHVCNIISNLIAQIHMHWLSLFHPITPLCHSKIKFVCKLERYMRHHTICLLDYAYIQGIKREKHTQR